MVTSLPQPVDASRSPPAERTAHALGPADSPRLYRYRPVPPVGCDDEGYPFEDNAPVQGDLHSRFLEYFAGALRLRYAGRRFVGTDLGLFYHEGDTGALMVPDVFVAPEPVAGHPLSYKLWERALPQLVLEVLSRGTAAKDLGAKKHTSETLGIAEYWVLDVIGRRAKNPRLTGYRLCGKHYQPICPNAAGHLASRVLGLEFRIVAEGGGNGEPAGKTVRLFDPAAGEFLPSWGEERTGRRQEAAAREQAVAAHKQAAAEREQAVAERDQAATEREQAVAERDQAAAERDQAAAERGSAEIERNEAQAQAAAALARVKELEAKLAAHRNGKEKTPP